MPPKQPRTPPREKLEVESDEERKERLGQLFNNIASASPAHESKSTTLPPLPQERSTFPVPPSSLLSRVQDFLPLMAASNAELLERAKLDPESVDIERPSGSEKEQVIAMDLGLGVFDGVPTGATNEDGGVARPAKQPESDSSDEESSSEESSSEEETSQ